MMTLTIDQMTHAIAASLKDLDPNNPWVKDAQGGHHDWPTYDSEEDDTEVGRALAVSLVGECSRVGCKRPRARNTKTHDFCSLDCSRLALVAEEEVYRVNVTADYNTDLVIALEMSRLQMIEDEMKKCQRAVEAASEGAGTSVGGNQGPGGMDDHQMKVAIQLSMQETPKAATSTHTADTTPVYHKTSADLTVDYFLKSLAGRQIDFKNLSSGMNVFSPDDECEVFWGCGVSKNLGDKELICSFKPCVAEDGRFEIGDIHENGRFNDGDDFDDVDARLLKRSHSTGDLCTRGRRPRHGISGDEPRYHLDSDHSSQHEEKPEDIVKRILAFPSGKAMAGRQFLLLHHHSNNSNTGEISTANSEDGTSPYFGGQSSVEDTTTTSDSLNADLEVCGILGTTEDYLVKDLTEEEVVVVKKQPDPEVPKKVLEPIKAPPDFATTSLFRPRMGSNSLLDAHRRAFKAAGGKATGNSNLRIRICKSPNNLNSQEPGRTLETDSSNEYESETGIPKSPTLYISGVSISRTPEPRSPALMLIASGDSNSIGRQSRSSSLTVPSAHATGHSLHTHVGSSASLNIALQRSSSPLPLRCVTPVLNGSSSPLSNIITPPPPPLLSPGSPAGTSPRSGAPSPVLTCTVAAKSKSANEPEREREMFRFPKSSTDGALSSVLHIQESNLSSDDFHEALFLLERSPKGNGGSSKRRKKSKKERDKDKENSNAVGGSSKVKEVKEASSAL